MNTTELEIRKNGTLRRSTDKLSARGTWTLRPKPRTAFLSGLLFVVWLLIGSSAFSQDKKEFDTTGMSMSPLIAVPETQSFSSGSKWTLTVEAVPRYGLVISDARFQKSPTSPFITVLHDGRFAEIFVPYHTSSHRYHDIGRNDNGIVYNFQPLMLTNVHRPPPPRVAQIIGGGTICRETRSYLAWIDDAKARYGQEVVYFSVLDAGNYNYIMEWTFRDDGTILARAGSTGPVATDKPKVGHMHNFTWRLDVDLNGSSGDSVYFTKHVENSNNPSTATDQRDLISTEGSRVWIPEQFNTLEVVDSTLHNGNGRETSYELVPARSGNARHSEPFTKADFWVTRYNSSELLAQDLPTYIANHESTVNADVVLWYTGSFHHENDEPDEDKNTVTVHWVGFELQPKNLWEKTPFYQ